MRKGRLNHIKLRKKKELDKCEEDTEIVVREVRLNGIKKRMEIINDVKLKRGINKEEIGKMPRRGNTAGRGTDCEGRKRSLENVKRVRR